jgi:predicted aldo/keto reductase-like oxidoreductase
MEDHAMALENELQYYRIHMIDMLGVNDVNEGKYVVIKNNEAAGIFDSFDDALDEGYKRFGLVPFLVKKLEKNESILYFSRPV